MEKPYACGLVINSWLEAFTRVIIFFNPIINFLKCYNIFQVNFKISSSFIHTNGVWKWNGIFHWTLVCDGKFNRLIAEVAGVVRFS